MRRGRVARTAWTNHADAARTPKPRYLANPILRLATRPETATPSERNAIWLGHAGLLPFLALLLLALFGGTPAQRQLGLQGFVAYSAVILSFLGGVRWGAALVWPQTRALLLAVLPALIASGLLLLPPREALPLLTVAFAVVGLFDVRRRSAPNWPSWFVRLRLQLSVAVVVMHLTLILALPE